MSLSHHPILQVENLCIQKDGNVILQNVHFAVHPGEIHLLLGPNGAGKSTLFQALAGSKDYDITYGTALFCNEDLLSMPIEERARRGMFLSFQTPIAIPGLSTMTFLKEMFEINRRAKGQEVPSPAFFLKHVRELGKRLGITDEMLKRSFNEGFSGGERKRMEVLQMLLLEPTLILLDEVDSGLDVDALRCLVSYLQESMQKKETALLIITHYDKLLTNLEIDHVHVLLEKTLKYTGDKTLALQIYESGFEGM